MSRPLQTVYALALVRLPRSASGLNMPLIWLVSLKML